MSFYHRFSLIHLYSPSPNWDFFRDELPLWHKTNMIQLFSQAEQSSSWEVIWPSGVKSVHFSFNAANNIWVNNLLLSLWPLYTKPGPWGNCFPPLVGKNFTSVHRDQSSSPNASCAYKSMRDKSQSSFHQSSSNLNKRKRKIIHHHSSKIKTQQALITVVSAMWCPHLTTAFRLVWLALCFDPIVTYSVQSHQDE